MITKCWSCERTPCSRQDPDNNQTSWQYNAFGEAVQQTNPLGTCYEAYDPAGELQQSTDADSRAVVYLYNGIGREVQEKWYASTNTNLSPTETIGYVYNPAGLMQSASDNNVTAGTTASDSFTYDAEGRVTGDTQQMPGLTPTVSFADQYTSGNRTQLAATIGATADFVNNYQYTFDKNYNLFGQMGQVTQSGTGITNKLVSFTYYDDGQFNTIARYQSSDTSQLVATSAYLYNAAGQVTSLGYTDKHSSTLAGYTWAYNAAGDVSSFTNALSAYSGENATYGYDATGQLLSATYANNPSANRTYGYDSNGNQNTGGSVVGSDNRITSDSTYTYQYDRNGNLTAQTLRADGSYTQYAYDDRNRLTTVTSVDNYGHTTQVVAYSYDAFNRLVSRTVTPYSNGNPQTPVPGYFAYDGVNVVLALDGGANVTQRKLYGPAVDQLLATDYSGQTLWALLDNQNTVRDLVTYNGATSEFLHVSYDAFGLPSSASTVFGLYGYTGAYYDPATNLQWRLNRWYNPRLHRWMSQDPLGLLPDVNPYRYCENAPTDATDPSGLDDWGSVGQHGSEPFARPLHACRPNEYNSEYAPWTPSTPPKTPPAVIQEFKELGGCSFTEAAFSKVMQNEVGTFVKEIQLMAIGRDYNIGQMQAQFTTVATVAGARNQTFLQGQPQFFRVAIEQLENDWFFAGESMMLFFGAQFRASTDPNGGWNNGVSWLIMETVRTLRLIQILNANAERIRAIEKEYPLVPFSCPGYSCGDSK